LLLLDNPIQNYAWGSRTSLAKLLGRPPSAAPEAELWIGAHPKAPSRLSDGRSLLDAIHADPDAMLGADIVARFGPQLPFLLKVLAVDAPLSLQAHPNLEQAARGFAREQAAGLALDAPTRTYKDANHKPELLCALTPFEALSGFRPAAQAAELFELLGVGSIALAAELRGGEPDALRQAFCRLMTLGEQERASVTADVLGRCERARSLPGPFGSSITWAVTLGARYPGDIGAVASLLLNHLSLAPLEAIFLEAGQLHAYLSGTGVEIMANSDNVLRGGLTPKHVDVPALLEVLRFDAAPVELSPTRELPSGEVRYEARAPEFCLSRIDLAEPGFQAEIRGPEILLCVDGQATLEHGPAAPAAPRILRRGQACFLSACGGSYALRGNGRVFRATVVPEARQPA
jgi:mannose-6-phosphate isomerase